MNHLLATVRVNAIEESVSAGGAGNALIKDLVQIFLMCGAGKTVSSVYLILSVTKMYLRYTQRKTVI